MGGAWSCCLPCAGGGGGGGGVAVSGTTPEVKKSSSALLKQHQQYQPHQQQKGQQHDHQTQQKNTQQEQQPKRICVAQIKKRAPLSDLDEDLDDDDDDLDDEEKECELRIYEEEDYGRESGTQHRLSPRLQDIEEEDDDEGRHVRERSVANPVSRVFRSSLRLVLSLLSSRLNHFFKKFTLYTIFSEKDYYIILKSQRMI